MIYKNLKLNYLDAILIIDWCLFGLGLHLVVTTPTFGRPLLFIINIDIIFIRIMVNIYK